MLVETGSQSSVPVLLAALRQDRRGARGSGGCGGHPHPPRSRRRRRRRGPGLSLGHRLRAREGGPPPGRPDPADRLGRHGSTGRCSTPSTVDSTRRRAEPAPRPGRRRGDRVGSGPDAGGGGLTRARQAPCGLSRLGERGPLRRRRRRGQAARRRGAAPGHPATRLRPEPGAQLSGRSSRPDGRRPWRWPTTACSGHPKSSWRRRKRRCGSGPRRPSRRSGRGPTSPRPCRRDSTLPSAASTPRNARSWRP